MSTPDGTPENSGLHGAVYSFTVRFPSLGPAVWVASCLYFFAQIAAAWIWSPAYSVSRNTISDLGNTHCGPYGNLVVCSPRHVLMNSGLVLLGAIMAGGSLLIYQEFVERDRKEQRAAFVGFLLIAIGGVGAAMVGLFPENTFGAVHGIGAALAIGAGNVGIFLLGFFLPMREGMRMSMLLWAGVSLMAGVLFAFNRDFGLGPGTMERIAAYPESIWLIRFGVYISRNHYSKDHARNPANVIGLS
jgi:hypothetical membrane protein